MKSITICGKHYILNVRKFRAAVGIIAEAAAVIAVTFIIFVLLRTAAIAERGNAAFGGECLAVLLPFAWYAIFPIRKRGADNGRT